MRLYDEAAQLLNGASLQHLLVDLSPSQAARIERLAAANEWEAAEAVQVALACGLAIAQARADAERVTQAAMASMPAVPAALLAETWEQAAMAADRRYAAVKFLVFRLVENNQTLTHNRNGFIAGAELADQTTAFLLRKRAQLEQPSAHPSGVIPASEPPPALGDRALAIKQTAVGASSSVRPLPDRTVRYDIEVGDTFARDLAGEGCVLAGGTPSPGCNVLIDTGLALFEAQANGGAGARAARALDLIGGAARRAVQDLPASELHHALNVLTHFVDSIGNLLVMEARLARLRRDGMQLEAEVGALRAAHEQWRDWAWATREYLARLERARSAHVANGTTSADHGLWQRIRQSLFGQADTPTSHKEETT